MCIAAFALTVQDFGFVDPVEVILQCLVLIAVVHLITECLQAGICCLELPKDSTLTALCREWYIERAGGRRSAHLT